MVGSCRELMVAAGNTGTAGPAGHDDGQFSAGIPDSCCCCSISKSHLIELQARLAGPAFATHKSAQATML